jgi:Lon protease-like protein
MDDLPLFPLNTVLFPSTPISLHIFEARYLQMIAECVEKQRLFGVVLIRSGLEALGPLAEPYQVGCTAEIVRVENLPDGRMNIVAMGRERFRILSLNKQASPYLVGAVETFPLDAGDPDRLAEVVGALRPWVERYLHLLAAPQGSSQAQELPEDPLALAWLSAALLQSRPAQKQALLESEDAVEMMTELASIYRRETALLRAIRAKTGEGDSSAFSKN